MIQIIIHEFTIMQVKLLINIIAVIEEGKIAEMGNHNDLMELNGLYRMLVERQTL